jgi:hypothetical protein
MALRWTTFLQDKAQHGLGDMGQASCARRILLCWVRLALACGRTGIVRMLHARRAQAGPKPSQFCIFRCELLQGEVDDMGMLERGVNAWSALLTLIHSLFHGGPHHAGARGFEAAHL